MGKFLNQGTRRSGRLLETYRCEDNDLSVLLLFAVIYIMCVEVCVYILTH